VFKLIAKSHLSTPLILVLVVTLGYQSFAQATPNFAYFLDVINDSNVSNTPAGYAVIGEANSTQRGSWTESGRIVGMSVALNASLWSTISSNFSSSTPVVNKQVLAQNIITSALQYPGEFPLSVEKTPTANNGYVIWAQDFEYDSSSSTDELYAGVTAVLWAGRQLLGTDFKIIPVPASYLFKTLGGYNSSNIVNGVGSTPYLASLGLSAPPNNNPQAGSGGEWNFLSLLHANDLIDGFLGQQYAENNQDALPGSVSADTMHFYEDIPYAILSAHDNPAQLTDTTIGGPPWKSHYDGDMPFQAGVYWHTNVVSSFDPSAVLTPTEQSLTSLAIPEPSAFWLIAVGLGGLIIRRAL
jgi:hypothetical protein